MPSLRHLPLSPLLALAALGACSDAQSGADATAIASPDATASANPDATTTPSPDADVSGTDAGSAGDPDAAPVPGMDAAAPGADAAPGMDASTMGGLALAPGQHVELAEGRVAIGDTFTAVTTLLGAGTRTAAANTRSYEWTRPGGLQLTVWFANSNLDNDDDPPRDVDGTDRVLWIAVSGSFAGKTPSNVGLGSTRAAVEAAYMAAPRLTPIDNPAGTLAAYYTRGFLVAYAADDTVRTFTVTKRYMHEPDGRIDIANLTLDFGRAGQIELNPLSGSSPGDVRGLLGPPDSEGPVPNQSNLDLLNYAFIGLEVVISTRLGDHAATAIVHAPYYGTTGSGTPGLGSSRADFEAYASQTLGASGPNASSRTNGLFCFVLPLAAGSFGVTYNSETPPKVSAIVLGQCM